VALHGAAQCPERTGTLILGGSQPWIADVTNPSAIPIELDRVLGQEANFAGTSFLTLDQLHHLRYASPIVNVVADARIAHGPGLGTFAYDDEGVPAQCIDIIRPVNFADIFRAGRRRIWSASNASSPCAPRVGTGCP